MLLTVINVKKTKSIKDIYRRRSCTSKTTKKSPFHYICNVLFHHYSASSVLLMRVLSKKTAFVKQNYQKLGTSGGGVTIFG